MLVFVASAGNDASCRPTWPACLGHVFGVGAAGVDGPAPFTNYGPHVEACAPGVDIVSTFLYGLDPGRGEADNEPGVGPGRLRWLGGVEQRLVLRADRGHRAGLGGAQHRCPAEEDRRSHHPRRGIDPHRWAGHDPERLLPAMPRPTP